jgi:hypothetical protein
MKIVASPFWENDVSQSDSPKIDPLAAKMRIEEAGKRYLESEQGPRFKVGDWITPPSDSFAKDAGAPHLVIATRKSDHVFFNEIDAGGSAIQGRRMDTRVLRLMDDCILAFWTESAEFVPWECPTE